jgi:outer membrane lipoprotein LolB
MIAKLGFLLRPSVVVLSVFVLSGCENLAKQPSSPIANNNPAFELENWQLKGKLGIKTESDRASSSIRWQQSQLNAYQINLVGPLGQGAVEMVSKPNNFTLTSRGKTVQSHSPRLLLLEQLGWDLPVNHFQHWVKGIPAPDKSIDAVEYNTDGTLLSLAQDGWQIEFSRYENYGSWTLPGKLTAKIQSLSLTLIIRDWQTDE